MTTQALSVSEVERWTMPDGVALAVLERRSPAVVRPPQAILLWNHGGPGSPLLPFSHAFDHALLENFIVVHWDQRGVGRSEARGEISLESIAADGLVVVERLRERHPGIPLVLVGHSWGTVVTLKMAKTRPSDFLAVILVGTLGNFRSGTRIAQDFVRSRVEAERVGYVPVPDPLASVEACMEHTRQVAGCGGVFGAISMETLNEAAHFSPHYDASDWKVQSDKSGEVFSRLFPFLRDFDAASAFPRVEVPLAFVHGALDFATPLSLARDYFDTVDAPHGKAWYEMSHAAHFPMWEHPREFAALAGEVVNRILSARSHHAAGAGRG